MRREASLKKYLAWLPAVCMAAVIFLFSAQPADQSTETSDFVSQLLLAVFSRLGLLEGGPEQYAGLLEALSLPVRKCAHITEYAVFYLTVGAKKKALADQILCGDVLLRLHGRVPSAFCTRESREAYGCADRLYWRQPDHGGALVSI